MRILFVSAHLPTNLQIDVQGMFKRMRMFVDALKAIAELEMLFYVPPEQEISPDAIAQLEQEFRQYWQVDMRLSLCPQNSNSEGSKWKQQALGMFDFFQQGGFAITSGPRQLWAFEEALSRQPDAVFAHGLQAMCPALLTQRPLPPIFFDLDNIEHIMFMRQIRQPPTRLRTLLYYLQVPTLWQGERRAMQLAHRTFVCSEHDRRYLAEKCGLSGIVVAPNALNIPQPQPLTREPTLLLLGAYHYYPNINAANFLIEQVWPKVRQALPTAQLIIAGKDPHNIHSYDKSVAGVEFTGFVDDLEALYQRSRVVCCPIFSGGGTRVKMIEAAAYGKPIVASQIGAEGLEMQDGQEFLLRNQPDEFANACLELLQNDALCDRLGSAARAAAIHHYDRKNIVQRIQQYIQPEVDVRTNSQTYAYKR